MRRGGAPALLSCDLDGLVQFIQSDRCKNIAVLSGAGISVAAGIPDFRSAGGMYDTLKPELLTATAAQRAQMASDPTSVVSRDLFTQNPFPYLELRRCVQ
jgi:NAD-dependent deacetylase sirtuin 2